MKKKRTFSLLGHILAAVHISASPSFVPPGYLVLYICRNSRSSNVVVDL